MRVKIMKNKEIALKAKQLAEAAIKEAALGTQGGGNQMISAIDAADILGVIERGASIRPIAPPNASAEVKAAFEVVLGYEDGDAKQALSVIQQAYPGFELDDEEGEPSLNSTSSLSSIWALRPDLKAFEGVIKRCNYVCVDGASDDADAEFKQLAANKFFYSISGYATFTILSSPVPMSTDAGTLSEGDGGPMGPVEFECEEIDARGVKSLLKTGQPDTDDGYL